MEEAAARAAQFYARPIGQVAASLLRERLLRAWPQGRGLRVLGLGYAAPFADLWPEAERTVLATLGRRGPGCAADPEHLPFGDTTFDRVLLLHGLEAADNPRRLLREVWRVLRDGGQVLAVAPSRLGIWAHLESTPFGHGQPYSTGQIERLLAATMFRVAERDTALFCPPISSKLILRGARRWERCGRRLAPGLAGVSLIRAEKEVFAVLPAEAAPSRRLVLVKAA